MWYWDSRQQMNGVAVAKGAVGMAALGADGDPVPPGAHGFGDDGAVLAGWFEDDNGKYYFEEKGRPLTADIPEDIWVRGNEQQLYQLMDVLLDNALKYSEGPGAVEVCLKQQRKLCLLTVTSPGTPLTRQQQKDVFKRFYRADPARSQNGSYGLGLAIAQEIVHIHRGSIWAQGKDRFNTFFVLLPLCARPQEKAAAAEQADF